MSIESLNEYGYGVGQKGGQTFTVARSVPGDLVQVRAIKGTERWTSAELLKVISPGPGRRDSPCLAFNRGCGGCQWLHLDYPAQIHWKEKNLAAILRSRAGYQGPIQPAAFQAEPQGYRNKLSLRNVKGKWAFLTETEGLSLSPPGCFVQTPPLQEVWGALRGMKVPQAVDQIHWRSNDRGQVGAHAFVRELNREAEVWLRSLAEVCPPCVGVGVTTRKGYNLLWGQLHLDQTLGGLTWSVPHNGFFQTNAVQAEVLLQKVCQSARALKQNRVLDLYCGAGFFGLALAKTAGEVVGIEENGQSVEAAQASAGRGNFSRCRFLAGDMGAVLGNLPQVPGEIAVVDPPREGLLHHAMELLIDRSPQRIIYISCYPQSLVRDYKLLVKAGWKGIDCLPVDMFPHTSHLETVMVLER